MATHARAPHDRPRLRGAGATVGCHVLPTGAGSGRNETAYSSDLADAGYRRSRGLVRGRADHLPHAAGAVVRDADARLIVSDTGRGIEADLLPHICERFHQSDSTSTRVHAGLGLGLAIVRHLVELHGGRVRAESAGAGQGATITVVLPIAAAEGDGVAAVDQRVSGVSGGERLDGVRVLVVEDDADSRDLVVAVLTQAGAVPFAAASARDGMSMASRVRPDVLVCDLAMPDQDGLAVVRAVKSWAAEAGVTLPALALTAYARAEDRDRALAAGFDLYVTKPVDPSELVRAVARLVRR